MTMRVNGKRKIPKYGQGLTESRTKDHDGTDIRQHPVKSLYYHWTTYFFIFYLFERETPFSDFTKTYKLYQERHIQPDIG